MIRESKGLRLEFLYQGTDQEGNPPKHMTEILDHHTCNESWNYHNMILASCRTIN